MGAFAGSAALLCQVLRSDVSVITLTMNNSCNLRCPHCYLQFAQEDKFVAPWVVETIAESDAEAVAIVGMEPLLNRDSARKLASIVEAVKSRDKKVGVITNGLNAHLLSRETAALVDWVDVSVDGTRETYGSIRGAPVRKLERGIETLDRLGVRQINVLHTLHAGNLSQLGDLADFGRDLATGQVVLSPFCATRHEGSQPRDLDITSGALLQALERSDVDLDDCWIVLDLDWVAEPQLRQQFADRVERQLGGRSIMFRADPAAYGMVRITYDARVMTPRQAMHTGDYRRSRPRTREELSQVLARPAAQLI